MNGQAITNSADASAAPAGRINLPVSLYILGVCMVLFGVAAVFQFINFGIYPGDPTAFHVAAATMAITGVASIVIGVGMFAVSRPLVMGINVLLVPQQIAAVYLILQFALETRNPGSGTALGVFGIVGFLMGRFVAGQLRRGEVISAFFPDVLRETANEEAGEKPSLGRKIQRLFILPTPHVDEHSDHWVRDNLESIIIALIMALVIRTFALEAFKIPTGSMKPTLQGDNHNIHNRPVSAGDKILVSKFLYLFQDPNRWDIIVFKYPLNTKRNFIKRMAGVQNEQLLLFQGDVWTRPLKDGVAEGAFGLQRKPDDVQESLWIPFYSTHWAITPWNEQPFPLTTDEIKKAGEVLNTLPLGLANEDEADFGQFDADWVRVHPSAEPHLQNDRVVWGAPDDLELQNPTWTVDYNAQGFAAAPREGGADWATVGFTQKIFDRYKLPESREEFYRYDVASDREDLYYHTRSPSYQVGDIRVRCRVNLATPESRVKFTLRRGAERAVLILGGDGTAELKVLVTPNPTQVTDIIDIADTGTDLAARIAARGLQIRAGVPFDLAFSNADHRLRVAIDGVRLESWDYEPPQMAAPAGGVTAADFHAPGVTAFSFSAAGGPSTVGRIDIDRDIHYVADGGLVEGRDENARPIPVDIGPNQFLALGDNTRRSKDSRLWYLLHFEMTDGTTFAAEPDPTDDSLSDSTLLIRPTHREETARRWVNGELDRLANADLNRMLGQMQDGVSHLSRKQRLVRIEDTTGVVREVDVMDIARVSKTFAFAVPRENLIGRALFRFLPLRDAEFVR